MSLFGIVDLLSRGLDGASLRHKVLSNNLANENTPGFKRSDIDFKSQLLQVSHGQNLRTSHPRHLSGRKLAPQLHPEEDRSTTLRNDGNNVDVEREMVMVAENQLQYLAMIDSVNRKLSTLRTVINEGRR